MSEEKEIIPNNIAQEKDNLQVDLSKNPKRVLIIGFAIMLLLLSIMFVTAYILPSYIINKQAHYAKLIEITNKQNLRSERIVKLALRLRLCFEKRPCMHLIDEFDDILKKWKKAQKKLKSMSHEDETINLTLKRLYDTTHRFYAPMQKACEKLLNFEKSIFDSKNKREVDIIVQMILANESYYNHRMSDISKLFAQKSESQLASLQRTKLIILAGLVGIIILVVFLIYKIVGNRVSSYLSHIEEVNQHMQQKNNELANAYEKVRAHDEQTEQNARKLAQSNQNLLRTQEELEIVHTEVSKKNKKLEDALQKLKEKHRLEDARFMDTSLNKFAETMRWDQNQNIFSWTETKLWIPVISLIGPLQLGHHVTYFS